MLKAAKDAEPRVRVAALDGLAALKLDAVTEAIFRATSAKKGEAYGARRAALQSPRFRESEGCRRTGRLSLEGPCKFSFRGKIRRWR